jgi:ribosomal protein L37AE/L43A
MNREPAPDKRPEMACPKCRHKPTPSWGKHMLICSNCGWTMTYTEWLEKSKEDRIAEQEIGDETC